jgi:DNA-binding LacI/PurR family transcriptional regulator/signal transduction histidine kinase
MPDAQNSSSRRKTVGVFAARLSRAWGAEFMTGIMEAAEEKDVNVVSFVGGDLLSIPFADQSQPSYGLYDLIDPGLVDGLLLCSDLALGSTHDEIQKFCKTLAPIPVVSHAIEADGVSAFATDDLGGMRAAVRHLIEVHGYKRIAFIRGLAGHTEAERRYQAYREELEAQAIQPDERLILNGDYSAESGRQAVRTLFGERAARVDAIVAANDRMAFGAMEVLGQRGVRVPDQIALVGFDDISEADSLGVPLTTVRQPFYSLGRQAFLGLMKRMQGEQLPALTVLPASLVVRWSCGCLPESVQRAILKSAEVAQTGRLDGSAHKREAAVRAMTSAADIPENHRSQAQFKDVFGRTWDVLLASLREEDKSDAFLKMIQSSIELMQQHGRDASHWHNLISILRKHTLGGVQSEATALRAENLFQQARMLAGELSQRAQAYRRLQNERQEEMLGSFGFSIAPVMSLKELGDAITRNFPTLGIGRWYVMVYNEAGTSGSNASPQEYSLLLQYDQDRLEIPDHPPRHAAGHLIPQGKTPEDRRYSAIVMPLTLARNRFGFMWTEVGPRDWEIYVRVRNLVSSALLRTMLAQQREQAQLEVERLLEEARGRAVDLAAARDEAEKTAQENARLYEREQLSRHGVEALARASRQLSMLAKVDEVPQQILEQLSTILQFERGIVFLEDVNSNPYVAAHVGLPADARVSELRYLVETDQMNDMYDAVARMREPIQIGDVSTMQGWKQPTWLPLDHSWLGLPLFYKDRIMGMLVITRHKPWAFNRDAALVGKAFAVQAAIALENSHLYDEVNKFNQMMERMVAEKVEELNSAYIALEQHDQNKSKFINVAAHELRTPLTVIKGYLGMLNAEPAIATNETLMKAVEGVLQGTNRLHQIVNSMLDVARLENQVVLPHIEPVDIGPILRILQKEYADDLAARRLTLNLDPSIKELPALLADPELMKKAFEQVLVNSIKFTPDGGVIAVSAASVQDEQLGACGEIRVSDTGIGIDPANHKIIFDKLHQLGKVEFHSSSRVNFKGGGPGLGLAIAAGIIKAHQGKIWVESPGFDEQKLPGSTFLMRIPLAK